MNTVICGLLQPMVDMIQAWMSLAFVPLNFLGFATPPVASWFNPILQPIVGCTVT
ncbi:MAG: hypothetical protein ABII12_01255 [Planctomycetota bacterium]